MDHFHSHTSPAPSLFFGFKTRICHESRQQIEDARVPGRNQNSNEYSDQKNARGVPEITSPVALKTHWRKQKAPSLAYRQAPYHVYTQARHGKESSCGWTIGEYPHLISRICPKHSFTCDDAIYHKVCVLYKLNTICHRWNRLSKLLWAWPNVFRPTTPSVTNIRCIPAILSKQTLAKKGTWTLVALHLLTLWKPNNCGWKLTHRIARCSSQRRTPPHLTRTPMSST